jgi:hypothetical protein
MLLSLHHSLTSKRTCKTYLLNLLKSIEEKLCKMIGPLGHNQDCFLHVFHFGN